MLRQYHGAQSIIESHGQRSGWRHLRRMATKDGKAEYWAASTVRDRAVAAVAKELPVGWTATLTERRLTTQRVAALKMRPNTVQKL
jgi:hypothetical protein